jgi:hypothetical protein
MIAPGKAAATALLSCQLCLGVHAQRVGWVVLAVAAALPVKNSVRGDVHQARSAPGDKLGQFSGEFGIDAPGQLGFAFTGVHVCQRRAVDHPIRLGLLEQGFWRAWIEQVGLQDLEFLAVQRVLVRDPADLVSCGGRFQGQVQA